MKTSRILSGQAAGETRRRDLLFAAASLGAPSALGATAAQREPRRAAVKGRVRQSLAYWCLNATEWKWDVERICRTARALGCRSVELVPPEHWAVIGKHGLSMAIAPNGMPDPPFVKGLNNPRYNEQVIRSTAQTIERCATAGIPNVIAFTGYKWRDAEDPNSGEISLEEGAANSVRALKQLAPQAERSGVTICLEQLNTRDATHPMKGHPGYQGDDLDYCARIVETVASPRVKLLFDIYHVQIMNGDLLRRIRKYRELIGHVHAAGVPGRGELDDRQEVNYRAVIQALLDAGYAGYVGLEFIPSREPVQGLEEAVALCDV